MGVFDKIAAWFGWDTPAPSRGAPVDAQADAPIASAPTEAPSPPRRRARKPPPPETDETASDADKADDAPKTRATPAEDREIEGKARALVDARDFAAALGLLTGRAVLLAAHAPGALPCLCASCLQPELVTAEASGVAYRRDFVVTRRRALFYWVPEELAADALQVRSSMRATVRRQLSASSRRELVVRHGIDPFTKKPRVIIPKEISRHINPFTKKPSR